MLLSTVVNRAVLRGVLADSLTALCCYYNVSDVVVFCRFDVLISYMTAAVFDGFFFTTTILIIIIIMVIIFI